MISVIRLWGVILLLIAAVLLLAAVVDWHQTDIPDVTWAASGNTLVLAFLSGATAICGFVLIAADLLHQRLAELQVGVTRAIDRSASRSHNREPRS